MKEYGLLIVSSSFLLRETEASIGDWNPTFQDCTSDCINDLGCPHQSNVFKWVHEPCFSCRQKCIWKTVELYSGLDDNGPIPQFYGKWPFASYSMPFLSFIPMQEPASVFFSVLNLLTTLRLYVGASRMPRTDFMRIVWRAYAVIGIFAWLCSAAFHWSDFWLTEYLDYFSAFAVILFAFFTSISLVFAPFHSFWLVKLCFWMLLVVIGINCLLFECFLIVAWPASTKIYFDYGYNMWYCMLYSLATVFVYVLWISYQWKRRSNSTVERRSLAYLGYAVAVGLGSAALEAFDWPPFLWVFDTHSLFHLVTVPIPLFLLRFIQLEDVNEPLVFSDYTKVA